VSYHFRNVLFTNSVALLWIATASAQSPAQPYLALGDSVSFGFNPNVTEGDLLDYHGYPQFVSASLNLNLANASCPGETSTSFFDVTAPDLGCHEWRMAGAPLFVTYTSLTESQEDYAVSFLRANPKTKLVTITIGGNDLGLLQATCEMEFTSATAVSECELKGLAAVYARFAGNLISLYSAIRFKADYQGPIVAANYASPDYKTPSIPDRSLG